MSVHSMNATNIAKLACTAYSCQQITFFMYHYNSYAANPKLLRSPKPMVMRDFFLIRASPKEVWHVPNPLSSMYVLTLNDAIWNSMAAWAVGYRLVESLGLRTVVTVYILGGIFSSFAYVFQMQCSKTKKQTEYDCASMSTGAMAALCSLSLVLPMTIIPSTKRVPTALFSLMFLTKTLLDEYGPFMKRYSDDDVLNSQSDLIPNNVYSYDGLDASGTPCTTIPRIQLNNWGGVGGLFLGLIYGSIVLCTKRDMMQMRRFWSNMPRGDNPTNKPPIPIWANPGGTQQRM